MCMGAISSNFLLTLTGYLYAVPISKWNNQGKVHLKCCHLETFLIRFKFLKVKFDLSWRLFSREHQLQSRGVKIHEIFSTGQGRSILGKMSYTACLAWLRHLIAVYSSDKRQRNKRTRCRVGSMLITLHLPSLPCLFLHAPINHHAFNLFKFKSHGYIKSIVERGVA